MSIPRIGHGAPLPRYSTPLASQPVQGGASAFVAVGAALLLIQLHGVQKLRVAALPPGSGLPPGVPDPLGPRPENEVKGVNPAPGNVPNPGGEQSPLLNRLMENQGKQAQSLHDQLRDLRNQPVTRPGQPTPFPFGLTPPQAQPIPQGVPIQPGDLANKELRATLQSRTAEGTFGKTPVLGESNRVNAPLGLQPPAPQSLQGPFIPDLKRSGLYQFLNELKGLPTGRVGAELTAIKMVPVAPKPNVAADVGTSAAIVGTGFFEGARIGGPIGGVAGALFFSATFVSRALREEANSLEGHEARTDLAARDPNPGGDPVISLRLSRQYAQIHGLPQTVGPARDC